MWGGPLLAAFILIVCHIEAVLPQVAVKDAVLKSSQDHTHLQRCLAELEGLLYTEELVNVEIVAEWKPR